MAYSKKTKEKIAALEKQIFNRDKVIKKLLDELQDLNVKYKYTEFDVEATRRELECCKKMLKDKD